MKRYRSEEMKTAYEKGGYRERYAMDNGNKTVVYINNHKCYKFTYSQYAEYQDANGATYDTVTKNWINQKGKGDQYGKYFRCDKKKETIIQNNFNGSIPFLECDFI